MTTRTGSNEVPENPDNPYNIDFEKERRAKWWFTVILGGGFILGAILLAVAYFIDAIIARDRPEPRAVVLQQSGPPTQQE
ncbi:MAG: hypothetical protein AMXMBFR4_30850 [Candidatus Hydrogenedentota bacterium]